MSKVMVAKLKAENAVLRDLLETQYRETDKARVEAEKADDEAIEHKLEAARLRMLGTRAEYQLVWALKRRLDKAERRTSQVTQAQRQDKEAAK
jgi:hypothetical protein